MSNNDITTSSNNNRRIARNAAMLYVRMLVSMVVTLYTSRVVLQVLGAEDYGIYTVVGGVVAMFAFVNAAMSGATSRFLTFELGRGNAHRLRHTFASAMLIHCAIVLLVVALAETAGLWLLTHKLVIAPGRMQAAHWVYQFSILTMAVKITQVPYNASIIAHERMHVYAWVEIVNVTLQLAIVYMLGVGEMDRLVLYAGLAFAVSVVVAMTYRIYCIRNFAECHLRWVWKPQILRPMLSFSGWDLYGNMAVTMRQQGINVLQNMFFGARINAAAGITTTVAGALSAFAYNVITAFRPQIIKRYVDGDYAQMQQLMARAIKFTLALYLLMAIPLWAEMPQVLEAWLGRGQVPAHTVAFTRLVLAATAIGLVNGVMQVAIHATGRIRALSFITGSWFLVSLLPIWIMFRLGMAAEWSYVLMIASNALVLITNTGIRHHLIPAIKQRALLLASMLGNTLLVLAPAAAAWWLQTLMPQGLLRLLATIAVTTIAYGLPFVLLLLTPHERQVLLSRLHRKK